MKSPLYILLFVFFASCVSQKTSQDEIELSAPGIPLIIDADTANEIDDLYAIVRALVAPELDIKGITAAQFHNSPLATYNTVQESQDINERIIELMDLKDIPLLLGSHEELVDVKTPQDSEAARFIIAEAHKMTGDQKLQVAILGPCTNVASAILIDPTIIPKIEVSYIGFWHNQEKNTWSRLEFNSGNDKAAVDVLLNNAKVAFFSMTATTSGELKFSKKIAQQHLEGNGLIKDYLYQRWLKHKRWWSKKDLDKKEWVMWDVAIIEALINPDNATLTRMPGPKRNGSREISVYTHIDVEAMKHSFWTAMDEISNLERQSYLIKDVSILTLIDDKVLNNQDVLVENGKIKSITQTGQSPNCQTCININANGNYLLPGLSEMHAHIPVPNVELGIDYVEETMMLYLANGITVIRGMLGNPYHLKLREQVALGEITAPRIYTSSPSMNGNSIPTKKDAIAKVIAAQKAGYDFLKIHPGIKADVMKTLVHTADSVGIRYSGHVPFDVGIENALSYGYATVDHLDGYIRGLVDDKFEISSDDVGFFGMNLVAQLNESKLSTLAKMTQENNVWMVPTQTLFTRWSSPTPAAELMAAPEFDYMPAKIRYTWRTNKDKMLADENYRKEKYYTFLHTRKQLLMHLYNQNVGFLLGSDSPQVMNVPGFSIHHEIQALQESGLPNDAILKSGTSNPAIFFNEEGTYGTIEVGADADFIIVEDNPLDNMRTLSRPIGTMIQGKWLTRKYLDAELEKIAKRRK